MELASILAKNLKKYRGEISHSEFARQLKLPKSVLHRLETGEHNPTLSTIEMLLKALKCKPSDLLE